MLGLAGLAKGGLSCRVWSWIDDPIHRRSMWVGNVICMYKSTYTYRRDGDHELLATLHDHHWLMDVISCTRNTLVILSSNLGPGLRSILIVDWKGMPCNR